MELVNLFENKQPYFNRKLFRILFASIILIWIIGFSFLSIFHYSSIVVLFPFLKKFYSQFCHQVDYKTIDFLGYKLLVCARCSGIYLGTFISSFYFIFSTKYFSLNKKIIFVVSAIIFSDVIFTTMNLYNYSQPIAFTTGLLFGSVVFVYILTSLENFLYK